MSQHMKTSLKPQHLEPRHIGANTENIACDFLCKQGLQLVTRNYRCRTGEIDLIMQDQKELIFVEVRYRRSHSRGGAIESIDSYKQKKIIQAATYYLQQHKLTDKIACRFDVLLVSLNNMNNTLETQWIKDAFQT